jgi:hypothetical protein
MAAQRKFPEELRERAVKMVERTLTCEVTHSKGDGVRQWQLLIHGPSLLCRTLTCHPVPDGPGVIMSPRPRRGHP